MLFVFILKFEPFIPKPFNIRSWINQLSAVGIREVSTDCPDGFLEWLLKQFDWNLFNLEKCIDKESTGYDPTYRTGLFASIKDNGCYLVDNFHIITMIGCIAKKPEKGLTAGY